MFQRQLQGIVIAAAQQLALTQQAASPYRAHCMDHIFSRKPITGCDGRTAPGNIADLLPSLQKSWARLLMDPGVRTQTDYRPGIGGIHDGVHLHIGNVVSYNLKGHTITSCYYYSSIRGISQ